MAAFLKKRIAFSVLIVVSIISMMAGTVLAQTPEEKKPGPGHSIYKGSKAIQFGVSGNLTLKNFQDLAFSGKKHISDKTAVRIGLDLNFLITDSDVDAYSVSYDTTRSKDKETYNSDEIDLRIEYMRYSFINKSVKFYWSGGPIFGFARWFYKRSDDTPQLVKRTRETLVWLAGTSWSAGAEWFATAKLSLHAEYYLTLAFDWRRTEEKNYTGTTISYSRDRDYSFRLSSGDIRFGLSAYF